MFFFTDFVDEQNSPQAVGVIQHPAPDTTSPSPPHPYTTNGNPVSTVSTFPSAIVPQGNANTISETKIYQYFNIILKMAIFQFGLNPTQLLLVYVSLPKCIHLIYILSLIRATTPTYCDEYTINATININK